MFQMLKRVLTNEKRERAAMKETPSVVDKTSTKDTKNKKEIVEKEDKKIKKIKTEKKISKSKSFVSSSSSSSSDSEPSNSTHSLNESGTSSNRYGSSQSVVSHKKNSNPVATHSNTKTQQVNYPVNKPTGTGKLWSTVCRDFARGTCHRGLRCKFLHGDGSAQREHREKFLATHNTKPKPGDWVCDSCGNLNFAYRTVCRKCGKPKLKSRQLSYSSGNIGMSHNIAHGSALHDTSLGGAGRQKPQFPSSTNQSYASGIRRTSSRNNIGGMEQQHSNNRASQDDIDSLSLQEQDLYVTINHFNFKCIIQM